MSKTKQIIVIRRDLNMRRGKECAQAAHASGSWMACRLSELRSSFIFWLSLMLASAGGVVASCLAVMGLYWFIIGALIIASSCLLGYWMMNKALGFTDEEIDWITGRFTKVVLQVPTEDEFWAVYRKARDAGLKAVVITDSGATEFHGEPTATAIAIGPHFEEKFISITDDLRFINRQVVAGVKPAVDKTAGNS